jgi:hypothetical protein
MTSFADGPDGRRTRSGQDLIVLDGAWFGGWLALGIVLLLLLAGHRPQELLPSPDRLIALLVWPAVATGFAVTRRSVLVAAYAIGVGILLRAAVFYPGGGSDALLGETEWLSTLLSGSDPYGHFYTTTIPPGTTIGYPPVQFLLHLPGYMLAGYDGVRFTEVAAAIGIMATMSWLGRGWGWAAALPGLGLYAALPNLVNLSSDGGNDTSSGAVLLGAALALGWASLHGLARTPILIAGIVAGLALATKQSELTFVIVLGAFVFHRGGVTALRRYVFGLVVVLAAVSLPFLIISTGSYLPALVRVSTVSHADIFGWNIWNLAIELGAAPPNVPQALLVSLLCVAVATVVAVRVPYRRVSTAVLGGLILTLVALLTNTWTTYSYFALIAPTLLAVPILLEIEAATTVRLAPAIDGLTELPVEPQAHQAE